MMRRNPDAALHPLERARELVRAVNAAKVGRMLAKPFVGSLDGHHLDGVYCLSRDPSDLRLVASGSADGSVCIWNMASRKCFWKNSKAHAAFVRGVALVPSARNMPRLLSCGDDRVIRFWDCRADGEDSSSSELDFSGEKDQNRLKATFVSKGTVNGVDCQQQTSTTGIFASCGTEETAIWDLQRTDAPVQIFRWGADSVTSVRFNPADQNMFATVASDRSLMLHDLRTNSATRKVIMQMRGNAIAWNPQEPVYLTVASEDGAAYTYDWRFWDRAITVMRGHQGAIMDVDYSPTGAELVTASYDRTIRIFSTRSYASRDVYHTKRMQRVHCVRFSLDARYIFSGSDEGCVRLWKANAAESLAPMTHRQREAVDYADAVIERFKSVPVVRRIHTHRTLPNEIKAGIRRDAERTKAASRKALRIARGRKSGKADAAPDPRKEAIVAVKK